MDLKTFVTTIAIVAAFVLGSVAARLALEGDVRRTIAYESAQAREAVGGEVRAGILRVEFEDAVCFCLEDSLRGGRCIASVSCVPR